MTILACGIAGCLFHLLQAEPSHFLSSVCTPSWIDKEVDTSCIYPALRPDRLLEASNHNIAFVKMGRCLFFSGHQDILILILVRFWIFLGCSQDGECKNNLIEEQGESAEGVGEPQPATPCPPVVIDHQRLSVRYFINPLLFSVTLYLFLVWMLIMPAYHLSIDAL